MPQTVEHHGRPASPGLAAGPLIFLDRPRENRRASGDPARERADLEAAIAGAIDAIRALAGEAGGVLHLGATSAFLTDNADVLLQREGLELLAGRLGAVAAALADFAERWAELPCLAYTHFQPAQLTTVGKRACLWIQDLLLDLDAVEGRRTALRCREPRPGVR